MKEELVKKILIIGDGNHYFVRKLTEKLKKKSDNITIDCYSLNPISSNFEVTYDHIFDGVVKTPGFLDIMGGRQIYYLYINKQRQKQIRELVKLHQYDIVHIHYARYWISGWIKDFPGKVIVTIWGSDFYRASAIALKLMRSLFQKAHTITFPSQKMSDDFAKAYDTRPKHKIVRFGLEAFEYIDMKRTGMKRTDRKINITIGYNRTVAQQHLLILGELKKINSEILKDIRIIIPFTYGPLDKEYREEIENSLKELEVEYIFIEEFLEDEAVAELRLESDIMIQLQPTDAFSGSMQEYMYADNVVITGSWLPYDDMKKKGIFFEEIEKMEDLSDKLVYVISRYNELKAKCENNIRLLNSISGWDSNINEWMNLY